MSTPQPKFGAVALLLLITIAPLDSAAGQSPPPEILGILIGPRIFEVDVPATGASRSAALSDHSGRDVVIVVRGTFVYSQRPGFPRGQQDAKYRWGSRLPPGEKVCLPCTNPMASNLSFVIDDRYREPSREDFNTHTYVYVYRVATTGIIRFQILDDNYVDNIGSLQVEIYAPR